MKLTEVPFDKLCKMNKSYYFDQNNIEEFKQFEIQLNDFINASTNLNITKLDPVSVNLTFP